MKHDDPNLVYTMAIAASYGAGGNTAKVFEAARDNPKIPKAVLMAAALSGFLAASAILKPDEEPR